MMNNIKDLAKKYEDYIIKTRRHLHKHPELGEKEFETTKFIKSELEKLGIEVETFNDITGCIGTLKGGKEGKTIMLRADIDALPITETSTKDYCSVNDGVMHACGHDGHTATLLGAAKVLSEIKNELVGNVKFLFQMGEELGRRAEKYVERGALKNVDAIFGMHLWALMDAGIVNFQTGERMACSDRFTVKIKGKSSHGSAPHLGYDAIVGASQVVMGLQTLVSRSTNPLDAAVVTVGKMNGGTKQNIIANEVELVGTVRTFNKEFRKTIPSLMENLIKEVAKGYGCEGELDYYFGPSPLINEDENLVKIAREASEKILGEGCLQPLEKTMGAEDFSVYLESIPGVYGYVGVRNEEKGITYPHHHPLFDLDEDTLVSATGIYAEFAREFLK